jgi:hypothetical protein
MPDVSDGITVMFDRPGSLWLCRSMQLMLAKTDVCMLEVVDNLHTLDAASEYFQVQATKNCDIFILRC